MPSAVYEISYQRSVAKDLRGLPVATRIVIVKKILALAADPYPTGSIKLRGSANLFRLRHSDYRIIYRVENAKLTVLIIKVGHRGEVYRVL